MHAGTAPVGQKHVYFWGANSYGQLGQGHQKDLSSPSELKGCEVVSPVSVAGGGGHTLFVSENGRCYSCGSNNKGQLGLGEDGTRPPALVTRLTLVSGPLQPHQVTTVACGWETSFAITSNGQLFCWGCNAFGQLGTGGETKSCNEPRHVDLRETVVSVSSGLRHSITVTVGGSVYCCGSGKRGQLGQTDDTGKPHRVLATWKQVHIPKDCGMVYQVVAGAYHSLALTDTGQVIVWGDNKHGQLGFDPETVPTVLTPCLLPQSPFGEQRVKEINSGWTHVVALTEGQSVFSWGRGEYSQLGRITQQTCIRDHLPREIDCQNLNGLPRSLACGSEHNMLLTDTGSIYTWGWNEHGMCGTGTEETIRTPTLVDKLRKLKACAIGSGAGHCIVILQDNPAR